MLFGLLKSEGRGMTAEAYAVIVGTVYLDRRFISCDVISPYVPDTVHLGLCVSEQAVVRMTGEALIIGYPPVLIVLRSQVLAIGVSEVVYESAHWMTRITEIDSFRFLKR